MSSGLVTETVGIVCLPLLVVYLTLSIAGLLVIADPTDS